MTFALGCDIRPLERARVADVEPRFLLRLSDGRALRLVGLEVPDGRSGIDWSARARDALRAWLVDREIAFEPLGPADRWNRLPVRASAQVPGALPKETALPLAPAILEAGLARAWPEPETKGCFGPLAAAEAQARAALLGRWADPYYAVLAARDRASLIARSGQMVLVEGQALSAVESGGRTYLNFSERRGSDFSVMIAGQTGKAFASGGHAPSTLAGARLRIRGILDTRFGPRIDAVDPDQVDFLEAGPSAGAGEQR